MLTSSVSRLCMIFWCRVLFLQIPSKDQRHSKDCKDSNRSEQGILTPCHKNSQSGTDMIKFMKIFVSFILCVCVCVCVSIFLFFPYLRDKPRVTCRYEKPTVLGKSVCVPRFVSFFQIERKM